MMGIRMPETCWAVFKRQVINLRSCYIWFWSRSDRRARPRPTALLPPRSYGKPEAATAVDRLLMMGMRMLETCWAVFKRQVINLRSFCIWLVDSVESMMMHGLAIPKNTYFYVQIFFFENRAVYGMMCKIMAEPDRTQMTIQCGACTLHAGYLWLQTQAQNL